MGVRNFYKFLQKYAYTVIENKKYSDYSGKILGIDANLLLYKLLYKNFNKNINNNENNEDYEIYYLELINIICNSYEFNIKFIFVFDGKTPDIKKKTVNDRKAKRQKASEDLSIINNDILELEKYLNNIDNNDDNNNDNNNDNIINNLEDNNKMNELLEKKNSCMSQSLNLKYKLITETKEFLTMCGIPFIDSMNEADSQLAYLSKNNLIDGIISNDYDILTFGGKKLLINFFDYYQNITEISLDKLLNKLELTYDNFIELCILMGTDYSDKPSLKFEDIYTNIKNNKKYLYNNVRLPANLDIILITKYFKDCYANNYTQDSFNEQLKISSMCKDKQKIINFINIKKNIYIKYRHIKKICLLI